MLILGLIAGAVVAFFLLRIRTSANEEVLRERLESERRLAEEKLKFAEQSRQDLKKEFENVANRIFDEKNRRFTDESRKHLDGMLGPLRQQLGEFRKRVDDVYDKESQGRASLLQEIRMLKDLNQQISKDAVDLTNALKGESKTRGTWGEMVLEKVLEQSGLTNGREYETQVHLKEKHGGVQSRYPDVVVHLPEGRDVIIDSKVSLRDYETYCSAETDAEREAALKAHVAAVRQHVNELSAKKYEELAGVSSLDHVLMCIPIESAMVTAVSADPRVHEEALAKNVALVGPSTLMLTLRIVAAIWRQEYQQRNVLKIAERGKLLYDKFVGFVDDLASVGKGLDNARVAYDDAFSKLKSGPGNLVGQAEKLIKLGVKARKHLPEGLAEEEAEETTE